SRAITGIITVGCEGVQEGAARGVSWRLKNTGTSKRGARSAALGTSESVEMNQARKDRKTRQITIGGTKVGGDAPVVVQSMCATRTIDIDETVAQAHQLANAGAGIVRIAMDNEKEIPALKE